MAYAPAGGKPLAGARVFLMTNTTCIANHAERWENEVRQCGSPATHVLLLRAGAGPSRFRSAPPSPPARPTRCVPCGNLHHHHRRRWRHLRPAGRHQLHQAATATATTSASSTRWWPEASPAPRLATTRPGRGHRTPPFFTTRAPSLRARLGRDPHALQGSASAGQGRPHRGLRPPSVTWSTRSSRRPVGSSWPAWSPTAPFAACCSVTRACWPAGCHQCTAPLSRAVTAL